MSYKVGTDVGRLRELVGDTDEENEVFPDIYYEDLLSRMPVALAAADALRRIKADPAALLRKFHGFGRVTVSDLAQLRRLIDDEIEVLERSAGVIDEATGDDACTPTADNDEIGASTDEDGWYKESDIGKYLSS